MGKLYLFSLTGMVLPFVWSPSFHQFLSVSCVQESKLAGALGKQTSKTYYLARLGCFY